jgi:hypothetical protein
MWILSLSDLIFIPLLIVVYWLYFLFVNNKIIDPVEKNIFKWALKAKILGIILFIFVTEFYFQGGDTVGYYTVIKQMQHASLVPGELINIVTNNKLDHNTDLAKDLYDPLDAKNYYTMLIPDNYFICKVGLIVSLFKIKSYFWIAGILSLYAFSGSWVIFKTFLKSFEISKWYLAFPILFLPSVIFWSSGVMKDTLAFGAMGFSFYYLYKLFLKFEIKLSVLFFLSFNLLIAFNVKSYIAACLIFAIAIAAVLNFIAKQKSILKKVVSISIISIFTIIAIIKVSSYFSSQSELNDLAFDDLTSLAKYQQESYQNIGGGSNISPLFSGAGLPVLIVNGLINTLLRPFIWEVSNPMMILTALETLIVIWLGSIVIFRRKWLRYLISYPLLMFTFIFSIMLCIIIGVTTFNFGAMVRYKIPLSPFLMVFLVISKNIKVKMDK